MTHADPQSVQDALDAYLEARRHLAELLHSPEDADLVRLAAEFIEDAPRVAALADEGVPREWAESWVRADRASGQVGVDTERLSNVLDGVNARLTDQALRSRLGAEVADSRDALQALARRGLAVMPMLGTTALRSLMVAPNDSRLQKTLAEHAPELLPKVKLAVEQIAGPDLDPCRIFLLEANRAFAQRNYRAAQALATNVTDTLLRRNLDMPRPRKSQVEAIEADAALWFALAPVVHVYRQVHEDRSTRMRADAHPQEYSRHLTVHDVSAAQLSPWNALRALLLATSLLTLAADLRGKPVRLPSV